MYTLIPIHNHLLAYMYMYIFVFFCSDNVEISQIIQIVLFTRDMLEHEMYILIYICITYMIVVCVYTLEEQFWVYREDFALTVSQMCESLTETFNLRDKNRLLITLKQCFGFRYI